MAESVQHHTFRQSLGKAPLTNFPTLTPSTATERPSLVIVMGYNGAALYLLNSNTSYADLFADPHQAYAAAPYQFTDAMQNTCNSFD